MFSIVIGLCQIHYGCRSDHHSMWLLPLCFWTTLSSPELVGASVFPSRLESTGLWYQVGRSFIAGEKIHSICSNGICRWY
ncbi:hypothetical protein M405DRAFT_474570 [Rhizopogon salebrosus TDB-379]|nr:hypothetical protein M405DRAFT_474570 [Rhizopogon salebrosus TDB-379]